MPPRISLHFAKTRQLTSIPKTSKRGNRPATELPRCHALPNGEGMQTALLFHPIWLAAVPLKNGV
ncbi:hypothetical protein CBM2606_A140252 [Cupriavidus taiwanensis]|nr:hypothetical protein CBM2606_A140252 [Cupriavidus taiwanensis]